MRWLWAALAAPVLTAAVLAGFGAATAEAGPVRVAGVPATAQARARSSHALASPTLRMHITVALRSRDPSALAAEVNAVSTPGSRDYGRYLSPARFATRFGAPVGRIRAVRAALRARGLHPGPTSPGGLSIPITATAAALSRGLQTSLAQVRTAPTATRAPALPRAAAGAVLAVIGLNTTAQPHALTARGTGGRLTDGEASASPGVGPQPCPTAASLAPQLHALTENAIASAYDFDGLYADGDDGGHTTVAVYELEPDDPADIAAFQACYHTHAQVSYVHVDGGAGAGAGSDEAAFDIENLIGFAPAAHVLVYQAPNADSATPGSGPYDLLSTIVNQDRAQVVTISWGECEAQLGAASARAEHLLLEQAAVQGQTVVAAAGDSGAEDCATGSPPDDALAVDDPGSQPDTISVGGTTLTSPGPPPLESVWNSAVGAAPGTVPAGAGGGGVSAIWAMGPDQLSTPARLGLRDLAGAASACEVATGLCREVPDVSADADPATGYEIYWNGADTVPEPSGWQDLGGTSGAAPLWAALIALADSLPACGSKPIGFAGPALYAAAAEQYASDFNDVRTGENDLTGSHDGLWAAAGGYDLATGLGTPNAAPLAAALCEDSVSLPSPGDQASAAGARVAVRVHAVSRRGGTLRYFASHLPPGVRLDHATGRLSGRPARPGVYRVTATVATARGGRAQAGFRWSIGGSPHVTAARLSGRRLTVEVRSGRRVPAIRSVRLQLPRGLRGRGGHAITVRSGGRSAKFAARVETHSVTILLPTPRDGLSIALGPGALHRTRGRVARLAVVVRCGTTGTSRLVHRIAGSGR